MCEATKTKTNSHRDKPYSRQFIDKMKEYGYMLQTFQRCVFSIGHMRNQIMSSFAKYIKQLSKFFIFFFALFSTTGLFSFKKRNLKLSKLHTVIYKII